MCQRSPVRQKSMIELSDSKGKVQFIESNWVDPMRIWSSIGMVELQLGKRPIKEVVIESDRYMDSREAN